MERDYVKKEGEERSVKDITTLTNRTTTVVSPCEEFSVKVQLRKSRRQSQLHAFSSGNYRMSMREREREKEND